MDNVIKLIDARKRRDMALAKKEADKNNQEQVAMNLLYKSVELIYEALMVVGNGNGKG